MNNPRSDTKTVPCQSCEHETTVAIGTSEIVCDGCGAEFVVASRGVEVGGE